MGTIMTMDLYWTCAHAMKWPLWGGHLPDIALRSKTAKNDPAVVCAASKSHPSFAKEQAPALEVSRRRPRPPAHAYNSRRRTFSCLKALGVLLTILVSLLSMSFTQQSRSDAAPPTRQHLEVIRQQGKKYPSDYTADGLPLTTVRDLWDNGFLQSLLSRGASYRWNYPVNNEIVSPARRRYLSSLHKTCHFFSPSRTLHSILFQVVTASEVAKNGDSLWPTR